jgi:hypothetical protein
VFSPSTIAPVRGTLVRLAFFVVLRALIRLFFSMDIPDSPLA